MKRALLFAAALVVPCFTAAARADTTWLPGDARAITRSTSASRDAPVFEYAYGPRAQASIGAELGIVEFTRETTTLRIGFYALLALENASSNDVFPPQELWRGLLGAHVALELPRLARAWLVPGSKLEIALVVGREDNHATQAPTPPLAPPGPSAIPFGGGGDFLAPEIAVSLPLGRSLNVVMRLQDRIYWNALPLLVGARVASDAIADGLHEGLANAPGADIIVRWRATPWLAPQLAIFAEHLFPHDAFVEDGSFLRVMAGLVTRGRVGELEPFVSFDGGNGKGLLIEERALRLSVGVRYALF